jgi:ATP-dependent protease ClpP protease subunit
MMKHLLIAVTFLSCFSISMAEVKYGVCNQFTCDIQIYGEITDSTLQELERAKNSKLKFVSLNSTGGDVSASIRIARLLRDGEPYWVTIEQHSVCYSSCVLLLAGAGRRDVAGKVGIHRPYSSNVQAERSVANIQVEQKRVEAIVKGFLAEVNVNPALYDDMMATPPHRIKVLSRDQLEKYGISDDAPDVEQAENERLARAIGISMPEFLKRKALGEKNCRNQICKTATWVGISVNELNRRKEEAQVICAGVDLKKLTDCITGVMYRNSKDR